jgi:GAF domain-containing protein
MTTTEETAPLKADVCAAAHARALQAFADVGAALGASSSVDDVLRVIARKIRELVGVERCSVFLREGDAGLFRGRVTEGGTRELAPYVKRSFAGMAADGMTSELVETGRPVIVADAHNDPRMIRSNTRFWNIRSMLAVPMIVGERVIGIIYLDDVERPHRFQAEDGEIALTFARLGAVAVDHANLRADLVGRLDVAERRVRALRRANAIDERLSELILDGAGLPALVDAIAQLHGKPCAVYDAANTRLAVASPAEAGDRIVPRLLEEPSVSTPELAAALAAGGQGRVFVVPPMPDAGVLHRHLVAPIIVDGQRWGHLVMMEHRARLNGSDMITMRRAATLVALQAANERRAVEADWNGGASLAAELLTAGSDPETVARRAARLGVDLDAPHAVAVFATRCGADAADFRAIASAFGELAPELDVQATKLGQSVGALIAMPQADQPEQFAGAVKDLVAAVCERVGGELIAGVSSLRGHPEEYPCAHAEALEIVECIRRFGGGMGPAVFSTRDLGLGRVFLATADPKAVTSFASATFGSLVEDASKRDLLATLSCFFEHMASVRRCAAHLAVHENTIRYRLARIEELTGLAITHDPDAQLGARLSLLVLMLTGSLAPSDLHHGEAGTGGDLKLVSATS